MKKPLVALTILMLILAKSAVADSQGCPAVDCDCAALASEQWRNLCYHDESTILKECVANQGVPQRFCRMQGPNAFPTPLSVKPRSQSAAESDAGTQPPDVLKALISTQYWSLDEDLANLHERESERSLIEATKVGRILDRNVEKLFQLQQSYYDQVSLGRNEDDMRKLFRPYVQKSLDLADRIGSRARNEKGDDAPVTPSGGTDIEKQLHSQLQRTTATLYEQVGYMQSWSGAFRDAALTWQKAAGVSERLAVQEEKAGNNQRFVDFYREQSAARWHKATYFWLKNQDTEQALLANRSAANALLTLPEKALAEAEEDSLNAVEDVQRAAIKR